MRPTAKYFLITLIFTACEVFAQSDIKFELLRNYTSSTDVPRLKGYTGSIYFKGKNVSFSVSSGISEMEQSAIYLRDYKNSDVNYRQAEGLTVIPLIFGGQYIITKAYNLEYLVEAETGLNLLRYNLIDGNYKVKKNELHFGVGAAGGINYSLTHFLQLVVKVKFNIASKIGKRQIFNRRTRYVSVLTGLKIAI
jgi:hypothetical protein